MRSARVERSEALRGAFTLAGPVASSKGVFTLALHACLYEGQGWVGRWEGGPANNLWKKWPKANFFFKGSPSNTVGPYSFGQNWVGLGVGAWVGRAAALKLGHPICMLLSGRLCNNAPHLMYE